MPYVLASAGFTPPGPSSFWHPLIGDGAFAVTRSMFVVVATVILVFFGIGYALGRLFL